VKFLLGLGADPNRLNNHGRSPLHLAVAMGHAEVAGNQPFGQNRPENNGYLLCVSVTSQDY